MSDPNDYFIRQAKKNMERYFDNGNLSAGLRAKKQYDALVRERRARLSEKQGSISDTREVTE